MVQLPSSSSSSSTKWVQHSKRAQAALVAVLAFLQDAQGWEVLGAARRVVSVLRREGKSDAHALALTHAQAEQLLQCVSQRGLVSPGHTGPRRCWLGVSVVASAQMTQVHIGGTPC